MNTREAGEEQERRLNDLTEKIIGGAFVVSNLIGIHPWRIPYGPGSIPLDRCSSVFIRGESRM
jgi:hypothetical protein